MKTQLKKISLMLMLFISASLLQAQQMPPIPVDGKVRIGKLEN